MYLQCQDIQCVQYQYCDLRYTVTVHTHLHAVIDTLMGRERDIYVFLFPRPRKLARLLRFVVAVLDASSNLRSSS